MARGRVKKVPSTKEGIEQMLDIEENNAIVEDMFNEEETNEQQQEELETVEVRHIIREEEPKPVKKEKQLINCLRNEQVIVRFLARPNVFGITDPKHTFYGGMAENAVVTLTVPKLRSGIYANILTNDEKDYLEYVLGLEPNSLSVYKKDDNFWDENNPEGINRVKLRKQDNRFDLSVPEDYIRVKILEANKTLVCPSMEYYQDHPDRTYKFVIVRKSDNAKGIRNNITTTQRCWKWFGKNENDLRLLRTVIELANKTTTHPNMKLVEAQEEIMKIIKASPKMLMTTVEDPLLDVKNLIKASIENRNVFKRGEYYYLKSTNEPMCFNNQEPTLSVAAKWLADPRNTEFKMELENAVE